MVNEGKIMEEAKAKALQAALAQIEKQFGKGSIMKMDSQALQDIQVVSTGSLGLDIALGVEIDELLISQPDTGEQALEIADMLVRSGSVDVIVIDSVAALTPKAEIE